MKAITFHDRFHLNSTEPNQHNWTVVQASNEIDEIENLETFFSNFRLKTQVVAQN